MQTILISLILSPLHKIGILILCVIFFQIMGLALSYMVLSTLKFLRDNINEIQEKVKKNTADIKIIKSKIGIK